MQVNAVELLSKLDAASNSSIYFRCVEENTRHTPYNAPKHLPHIQLLERLQLGQWAKLQLHLDVEATAARMIAKSARAHGSHRYPRGVSRYARSMVPLGYYRSVAE